MAADILPDSRTKLKKGAIPGPGGVTYVPIYCANCGKKYGYVPESHITCAFALCDQGCAGKYGDAAHKMIDVDAIYRERATAEQIARYGRPLTAAEVQRELESTTSPLAALARDWANRLRETR